MWRSVQEERPRRSTSGGQSWGGVWVVGVVEEEEDLSWVFASWRQEEKEVQLRHLGNCQIRKL